MLLFQATDHNQQDTVLSLSASAMLQGPPLAIKGSGIYSYQSAPIFLISLPTPQGLSECVTQAILNLMILYPSNSRNFPLHSACSSSHPHQSVVYDLLRRVNDCNSLSSKSVSSS
jgi:hypothetical protein